MLRKIETIILLIMIISTSSCTFRFKNMSLGYSMTGASISPDVKTYSVDYFQNKALLVVPYLSTTFTENLKSYIKSKTGLSEMTENNGDVRFEGEITSYTQAPINIQKDEVASSNRLTIEIRVKYTNTLDDKYDFDQRFSHYADYATDADFDSIEESLIKQITDEIIEDIYNKAFVNW